MEKKKKKEAKKKRKAIRPWMVSWSKRVIFGHFVWVPEWARNTEKERVSACELQSEEIERYTVRVWESEKEKSDIFLCSSHTHKEDKLVEFFGGFWVLQLWRAGVFRGRFCYWYCGDIVFYSLRFNLLCI